jgi:hypothetical protein
MRKSCTLLCIKSDFSKDAIAASIACHEDTSSPRRRLMIAEAGAGGIPSVR